MQERLASPPLTTVYEDYEKAVNAKELFPQRQGLTYSDYEDALGDPRTASTSVIDRDGHLVLIPQLTPLENYSWLNHDFYRGKFTQEVDSGNIYYYTEVLDKEPSAEVGQKLLDIAQGEGVLSFDFPDSDQSYAGRLAALLNKLGITVKETHELGEQTYFAGKVKLKAGFDPSKPIMDLHMAFQHMSAEGTAEKNTAYMQVVDAEQSNRMQNFYEEAFQALNGHPCRQGLEPEEFSHIMTSEPGIAKLVYKVGGEITTVCILGDDLNKYSWLNPAFYKEKFPLEYAQKQILYFAALATDPTKRGERYTKHIVNLIAEMVQYGNNEILVAFDSCDVNTGLLDVYLEMLINATPQAEIKFDKVGVQKYFALKLTPRKAV